MDNSTELVVKNTIGYYPNQRLHLSRDLVWSLAAIKYGETQVKAELGAQDTVQADAIIRAAQEVMEGVWDDQIVVDSPKTVSGDYYHLINRVIAGRAIQILEGHAGLIKKSLYTHPDEQVDQNQSGYDEISAALRLGCLKGLGELLETLGSLKLALDARPIKWTDASKPPRPIPQPGGTAWISQELCENIHAIARDSDCLRAAGEALRRLSMQGPPTGSDSHSHPDFQFQLLERISQITGLPIYPSDHTSQSIQALAELDAFSTALRALLVSLRRAADELHRQETIRLKWAGKFQPLNGGRLSEIMRQLQACDLTIALAAQARLPERAVMMPAITCLLFEGMEGVKEVARWLAGQIPANLSGCTVQPQVILAPEDFLMKSSVGLNAIH
jgi:fumarate hydratase class II